MNPKTQAIIAAAQARTKALLEAAANKNNLQALPSSVNLALDKEIVKIDAANEEANKTLYLDSQGQKFDPFELPGVGRANTEQSLAIQLFGIDGKSGCLIGPAGTGKTTTMRALIRTMIMLGKVPILPETFVHKYLKKGLPGIWGGSFTRIATRNLKNNVPGEIQDNIHTIHRLLEFEPEVFEVADEKKPGYMKKVRIFKPTRNSFRTLPRELCVFFIDESSMVGLRLEDQRKDAVHPGIKPQVVYLGDIAQIPPVMDDSILGYAMLDHLKTGTCVELKEVYRHAGAIVNLANHIRVGNTIPDNRTVVPYLGNLRKLPKAAIDDWFAKDGYQQIDTHKFHKEQDGSKVTFAFWKKRMDGEVGQVQALQQLGIHIPATNNKPAQRGFFVTELEAGRYNPLTDMILIPYNKSVGTIELNKYIANYLSRKANNGKGTDVYEVIAGRAKHYFAIGDKVFYEREEAIITKISLNASYAGRSPKLHSPSLDRWGHDTAGNTAQEGSSANPADDLDILLNIDIGSDDEERKNQASHVVYVRKLLDCENGDYSFREDDDSVQTAAELNSFLFGYALTIHKSQGSQWPKVYCVFHNSHNRNLQRELLYTAITRAQKELYIIAEPESFVQGVISQHIVGNTLEEKAKFFIEKAAENKKRNDLFKGNGE